MMKNKGKICISSFSFSIYFYYSILISLCEIFDGGAYLLGMTQPSMVSRIMVFFVFGLIIWISKDKLIVEKVRANKWMVGALAVILITSMCKLVYPDASTDTLNYHLIIQHPGFDNLFADHFAKGNEMAYGFRLGDRLFYGFRLLLGYRFGTILNTLVLMICYVQLKLLLTDLCPHEKELRFPVIDLWALLMVLSFHSMMMIGTYYVDILGLPLGIEGLRFVLRKEEKCVGAQHIFFASLMGLMLAFKMTNIVYVFPLLCVYIVVYFRKITAFYWGLCSVCCAIPSGIYMARNFHDTKNPIFAYFNSIFQSDYFPKENYLFDRHGFGGENLCERLFWAFSLAFRPGYRQGEIVDDYNILLIASTILLSISFVMSLFCLCRKKFGNNSLLILTFLFFFSQMLWGLSTGYSRYFVFGTWILEIGSFVFLMNFKGKVHILVYVLSFVGVIQMARSIILFEQGKEWAWREVSPDTYFDQLCYSGKDRIFLHDDTEVDMFFISNTVYAGFADLIDHDAYVFNAGYFNNWALDAEPYDDLFEKHIGESVRVYDIKRDYDFWDEGLSDVTWWVDCLNRYRLHVMSVEEHDTDPCEVKLVGLEHTGQRNELFEELNGEIVVPLNGSGNLIRFYGGLKFPHREAEVELSVERHYSDGRIENDYYRIEAGFCQNELWLEEIGEIDYVTIRCFSTDHEDDWTTDYFIINPELTNSFEKTAMTVFPELSVGEKLYFGDPEADQKSAEEYVVYGVGDSEGLYSWTIGKETEMCFSVEGAEEGDILKFCFSLAGVMNERQDVVIIVNDTEVFREAVTGSNLEFAVAYSENIQLQILLPDAISPSELGINGDERILSLALESMIITRESKE